LININVFAYYLYLPSSSSWENTLVAQTICFDSGLIRRFDVPGPRYTSYPTADRFGDGFDEQALTSHLSTIPVGQNLSLYFHIPFCNTICYYCGCNKIITKG